mmetsp:Transcript_115573/g.323157  ORF Transcript_115573/g.323157 Transcript_115573/m.323157 type:complete len:342 (+) Transcript_115573:107-1132(+)
MFGVLSCTKIGCHARPGASGYDLTGCKPWPPEDGARWAPISDGEGDTHENYGFVGSGGGSWEREVVTTYESWRLKPQCKCLLALLASVALGATIGAIAHAAAPSARSAPQVAASAPGRADCEAAVAHRKTQRLSVDRMDDCCHTFGVGCLLRGAGAGDAEFYFCQVSQATSWSKTEAAWCCANRGMGCSLPDGDAAAHQATAASRAVRPAFNCSDTPPGGEENWPSRKQVYCIGRSLFSCSRGDADAWDIQKLAWCCEYEEIACASLHNKTRSNKNVPGGGGPTAEAAEWSASLHNCSRDLSSWKAAWAPEKKAWCCRNEVIGCPPIPAEGILSESEAQGR